MGSRAVPFWLSNAVYRLRKFCGGLYPKIVLSSNNKCSVWQKRMTTLLVLVPYHGGVGAVESVTQTIVLLDITTPGEHYMAV